MECKGSFDFFQTELIVSQIYDHVNVQYTYNKTYYETLPPTFLQQARYYANWAQNSVFTDSTSASIGQGKFGSITKMHYTNLAAVAIRTLLPEIFWALGNMTKTSNKVKMNIQEVDYKPFISLFNVTNATLTDPDISGIGQYQQCMSSALQTDTTSQPTMLLLLPSSCRRTRRVSTRLA